MNIISVLTFVYRLIFSKKRTQISGIHHSWRHPKDDLTQRSKVKVTKKKNE